jgi:hypothetical protein
MFKVSHALVTTIREYSCLERWRYITKQYRYKTVHVTKQYCTCYRKVTLQNSTSYKTLRYKPLTVTKRYVAKWYGYKTVHCLWLLPIFGQTLLRNGFKYHSIKKTWGLSFKDVLNIRWFTHVEKSLWNSWKGSFYPSCIGGGFDDCMVEESIKSPFLRKETMC